MARSKCTDIINPFAKNKRDFTWAADLVQILNPTDILTTGELAERLKADLKLLKLTDKVQQITKLHTVIHIMDDEMVAIESFRGAITATA
jgi:thiamine pyrophosphokinase